MLSVGKTVALIVPLVSYIAYNAGHKAPYASLSCSLLGIGCPSGIPIQGFVDDEYKEAYDIFLKNFKQGLDIGASISAYVDGRQVLSLQGGWQDPKEKIEYTNETLQMVYSNTKALDAIIVAQLVEKGLLNYDEPISTYWPEFAQGNKENVTLDDLMRHTSGVAAIDHPLSFEDVSNLDRLADILAKQPHNFDGKPIHAYHAVSQGYYQNEIIRRVDPQHRTLDSFAREFKDKWGSEWYLKPEAVEGLNTSRISPFYMPSTYQQIFPMVSTLLNPWADSSYVRSWFDKQSLLYRAVMLASMDQDLNLMNTNKTYRTVEAPSYSGHTNADSMAKLAAILANRGKSIVEGEPNLFENENTFDEITRFIDDPQDAIFPILRIVNLRGGFLLLRNNEILKIPDEDESVDFMGGAGASGSVFIFNEKYNIGFAYMTNGFHGDGGPDERSLAILRAIVKQVTKQKKYIK
ncbi:beta-lactamase/transpeptidase-like protein [Pilaira anomala]|nr:beta-lactamase/transpeptidase-like protein [Pilaira anomala]